MIRRPHVEVPSRAPDPLLRDLRHRKAHKDTGSARDGVGECTSHLRARPAATTFLARTGHVAALRSTLEGSSGERPAPWRLYPRTCHDDLASGEPVCVGSSDDEPPRGVDEELHLLRQQILGTGSPDDLLEDPLVRALRPTSSAGWVEQTTAVTSGERHPRSVPSPGSSRRAAAREHFLLPRLREPRADLWAKEIGIGISSSSRRRRTRTSSPGPGTLLLLVPRSTPCAMSADCRSIATTRRSCGRRILEFPCSRFR